MKSRYHLISSIIFFLCLYFIFWTKIRITEIIWPIVVCTYPDVDKAFGVHRSILTHSLLIPGIVYFFNQYLVFILFLVSISLHLLCDIHINKKKMRGYYTIKLGLFKIGLNGIHSTVFLLINDLSGIIFGITILVMFL